MFGHQAIVRLAETPSEPTGRLIYPAFEPQHVGMDEYKTDGVSVEGGVLYAYYFQPSGIAPSEDWLYGSMNGIEYGDIDNIEFIPD